MPLTIDLTDERRPLVRYEWRNQAGETLVVEASWPVDGAPPPTRGHQPPHVDVRNVN
jgi:hypothetical protein